MAIREFVGLHHIPNVSSSNAAQFNKMLGGLPFFTRGSSGNTKTFVFGGPANPWLLAGLTSSATSACWVVGTQQFVKDSPRASIFGVRLKIFSPGNPSTISSIISLASTAWGIAGTNNQIQIIQALDLLGEGEVNADLLNKEFYIELRFNWQAGTIDRRIDGRDLSSVVVPSFISSIFADRNIAAYLYSANGANTQWGWKDLVWIDDTEDDTQCDFMGPQTVHPAELTVEEAVGYIASTGTVQSVLDTEVVPATPDTPTIMSPVDNTPLRIGLSLDNPDIHEVSAVTVMPAVSRPGGSSTVANFLLEEGGQTTPSRQLIPGTTLVHNQRLAAFEKAPDGGAWTIEKLNNSKLRLTPSA